MPRRILKPDPDILRRQVEVERTPIAELNRLYGYSDVSMLYHWCRTYGITPYRGGPFAHLREITLTPDQDQVVLGTLLGDGSIRQKRGYGHSAHHSECLVLSHGQRQRDYLEWKKQWLEPFIPANEPDSQPQRGFRQGSLRYTYASIAHSAFTAYRQLFYPDGVKRITQAILERLESRAIAFWLMDDGSFHRTRGYIYLSTNCFTKDELQLAATWFENLLGHAPYIHSAGRVNQFNLAFNRSTANVLRDLVRPHFFEPLLYKIGCSLPG